MSVCAVLVICLLFVSELRLYLSVETVDHLYVDVSRGEKLRINFDMSFPHIPCSLLSLDAMDVSSSHQLDVSHHIKKKRIDQYGREVGDEILHTLTQQPEPEQQQQQQQQQAAAAGVRAGGGGGSAPAGGLTLADIQNPAYCGSCYGAESMPGQCCRSCSDVKEQYRQRGWAMPALTTVEQCVASGETVDPAVADLAEHRGCRMFGFLQVNKVAGNFHFAPGKSFQHQHLHVHDLAAFQQQTFNVSHDIHALSFGEPFPGQVNPLDAVSKTHLPAAPALSADGQPVGGMFMSAQQRSSPPLARLAPLTAAC